MEEKLSEPKLADNKRDIVRTFSEVCVGVTIAGVYSIIWLLLFLLGVHIYNWIT